MKCLPTSVAATILMTLFSAANAQTYTILHTFTGGSADGAKSYSGIASDGSYLYGLTSAGGSGNKGTLFKMSPDGSGFSILHSFTDGGTDGATPLYSDLTLDGSTLYGTTIVGGNIGGGTLFKIGVNGDNYSVLHSFDGGTDGKQPYTNLSLKDSTLYGSTLLGGGVFKVGVDGNNFTPLHAFSSGGGDGSFPYGVTLRDSTLYGVTYHGGGSGSDGTVFRLNTDGSGYTILHSFMTSLGDGQNPEYSVVVGDSALYGITQWGGSSDKGTVFKMGLDGGDYSILHSFTGANDDGQCPYRDLILDGSTLYGITETGGWGGGVIFQMDTDGGNFKILHNFGSVSGDGRYPYGLSLIGSTLYGTAQQGGSSSLGIVFSLTIPEPSMGILLLSMGFSGYFIFLRRRQKS